MKNIIFSILLVSVALFGSSFITDPVVKSSESEKITWVSWEEAVELSKTNPKKVFIDVYTNWCGWCKRMDKTTFQDPEVIKAIEEGFYAVKLNAEQKEDILFNGNTFKFVNSGRRGYHQLAQALLDGRMGYPSFVWLDESFTRIMISPGYKKPDQILQEASFARDEKYREMSFEEFKKGKT